MSTTTPAPSVERGDAYDDERRQLTARVVELTSALQAQGPMSDERDALIVRAVEDLGVSVEVLARHAGVNPQTFYRALRRGRATGR